MKSEMSLTLSSDSERSKNEPETVLFSWLWCLRERFILCIRLLDGLTSVHAGCGLKPISAQGLYYLGEKGL